MKIIELVSENFKRLNARVVMDGKSVTVEGKNGVGKSSFIDAVWVALTGKNVPAEPIKKGENSARIEVKVKSDDGSQFIVERKFSQSGGILTVKTVDGAKFSSPQKFLDEKIGRISFDPFEFVNKQPREQKKFLMELLGIDLTTIEFKKKTLLAERDAMSKAYNNLLQEAQGLPPYEEGMQEKNSTQAIEEYKKRITEIEEIKRRKANLARLIEQRESLKSEIERLTAELENIKHQITKIKSQPMNEPELTDIETEMEAINKHNGLVKINQRIKQILDNISITQQTINEKSYQIKQLEQERVSLISSAKMPIDGLSFSDEGLLFDGLPFTEQQLSTAKLIETGIKISIALNPSLRIMRIKDGSLLDSETLSIIKQAAKDNDYQLFIERVSDSQEIGFIIEE